MSRITSHSRTKRAVGALGLGVLVLSGWLAMGAADVPDCVEIWGEARYRNYGYDHIVHITNDCSARVQCDVWTNVNPDRLRVLVPAHEKREVLTFRGSPAREFTPHADCRVLL